MIQLVKQEVKQLLKNPLFYISVGLVILVLFQETYSIIQHREEASNIYVFTISVGWGLIGLIAPALCVIPYSNIFCKELKNKNYHYITIRVNRKKYLKSRFITGMFSSGSVLALGVIIYSIAISLIFCRIDSNNPQHLLEFGGSLWENIYNKNGGALFLLGQTLIAFIFGAVVGGISMVVAVISVDRFATIAVPFVLYYYMVFFAQRTGIDVLDLSIGIAPTLVESKVYYMVFISQMIILLCSYVIFIRQGKRRLING